MHNYEEFELEITTDQGWKKLNHLLQYKVDSVIESYTEFEESKQYIFKICKKKLGIGSGSWTLKL